jgi:hypothetical protein
MIFPKKKKPKDELANINLDEEEVLDFKEFEEFEEKAKKNKTLNLSDIEKGFIFTIEGGCPVCRGEVKGNDFYKYFCEKCNVLFDKKDIIDKEFGRQLEEEDAKVTKRKLGEEEKAKLATKRKNLSERVFDKFSPKEKEELRQEAEEREEEPAEEAPEEEPEEVEAEIIPPHPVEEAEEQPEETSDEPEEEKPAEYALEDPDKTIASEQSNKMHAGNCHFVKKINPDNRIHFDSIEEGEQKGYEMCVCLRRKKAKQR